MTDEEDKYESEIEKDAFSMFGKMYFKKEKPKETEIKMTKCKECGEDMNPLQVILSSTHGVCGSCIRKKHRLVIIGKGLTPRDLLED